MNAPEVIRKPVALQSVDECTPRWRDPGWNHITVVTGRFGHFVRNPLPAVTDVGDDCATRRVQNGLTLSGYEVYALGALDFNVSATAKGPVCLSPSSFPTTVPEWR